MSASLQLVARSGLEIAEQRMTSRWWNTICTLTKYHGQFFLPSIMPLSKSLRQSSGILSTIAERAVGIPGDTLGWESLRSRSTVYSNSFIHFQWLRPHHEGCETFRVEGHLPQGSSEWGSGFHWAEEIGLPAPFDYRGPCLTPAYPTLLGK